MEPNLLYAFLGEIEVSPFSSAAIISLFLSILLLGVSAFISASEVAFFSLNALVIKTFEESEKKDDKKVARLLENPQRLLATILIGNNFVNMAIILLLIFFTQKTFNFEKMPLLGYIIETIVITFMLLLFGEITPKVYATQFAAKVALASSGLLLTLEKIFSPFIYLLVNSTSIVNSRLAKHNKSNISMLELSQALELTSIKKDEDTEILEGIIKFGYIQVVDIMTSRLDMIDVDIKTDYKNLLDIIIKSNFSRIPVYSGSRDKIKGILYIKDLLSHLDKPATFRWQSLVRQPYFVPETKKIDDLLNEFQKNKVHLAIVVDEYGGISGLVTLEDILEEIVGDISDEHDEELPLFTKIDNHTFIFEAKIKLNDFFKIEEIEENDFIKVTEEVETLAGLILELKGEIPAKSEQIDYGRYVFEIIAVDNRRIKKVKLHIKNNFNENVD